MSFLEVQKASCSGAASSLSRILQCTAIICLAPCGLNEKHLHKQEKVSAIPTIPCLGLGYSLILDERLMSAAFPENNKCQFTVGISPYSLKHAVLVDS